MLKKKYILVVIDAFTKLVKLYLTASTGAREVCNALNQYFSYYSRPKRIISDRGTCFTSGQFANFLSSRGITHILNATASPQANGQVERVNRVIRPILSKLSQNSDYSDWVSQIHSVEYDLNNTIHSSTHFAPATLLFGIEQRGPILDEITEHLEDKNNKPRKDLQTIRAEASTNIRKSW